MDKIEKRKGKKIMNVPESIAVDQSMPVDLTEPAAPYCGKNKEVTLVEKTKSDLERLTKSWSEKIARAEEEIARLRTVLEASETKLSDTDDMLADAFKKLDKTANEVVIHTRGKLMNQYILGEIDSWWPEKDIEVWEQSKKLKAIEPDDEQGVGGGTTGQ
ncbi:hypothetical protein Ddye_010452 [Dipteronia dyeriana]|uniref:Uncharacterized protein n=1 Tax=Dipteronia dyeriana TaxID=168575 RepID=A0AAE0CN61_9ROSI|nr:hypothetical protein Ddye_010452 [Dipteronia dyeriana]